MAEVHDLQVELLANGSYLIVLPFPLDPEDIEQIATVFPVDELDTDEYYAVLTVQFRHDVGEATPGARICAVLNKVIELQRLTRDSVRVTTHSIDGLTFAFIKDGLVWAPQVEEPTVVTVDDIGFGEGNEILVVRGTTGFEIVRILSAKHGTALVKELHNSDPIGRVDCSLNVAHRHPLDYLGIGDSDEFPQTFAVRSRTEDRRELVSWMLDQGGPGYDRLITKIIRYFPEDFVELRVERQSDVFVRIAADVITI
ncbi:MAG: hypothetical protein WBP12_05625 [Candidatus Saccharimonas sp.]